MADPVTAVFTGISIALTTADQIDQLIARLTDHSRTLAQAETDRRAASADLFPPAAAEPDVIPAPVPEPAPQS